MRMLQSFKRCRLHHLHSTRHSDTPRTYATQPRVDVRPISGALGAEMSHVDLSRPLHQTTIDGIRRTLLQYQVVFFRNQHLDPSTFLQFGTCFGTPLSYPFVKGMENCPKVVEILKREHEKQNFGSGWHSDTSYLEEPPMASILLACEVPAYGGDTVFSNQCLAYEALSSGLRETLCSLRAVNTSYKATSKATEEGDSMQQRQKVDLLQAVHPVVRTHPKTGRKSLFVNEVHTSHFEGWTKSESAPLLHHLFRHQIRPEFTCRFSWQVGSVAFWDNRCTQHYPINDYHGYRRQMWRLSLAGDQPR